MRPSVCVDANLLVLLLTPHPLRQTIRTLWGEWVGNATKIAAPLLLRYEFTNAVWRMAAAGLSAVADAEEAVERLVELPLVFYTDPSLHREALSLARHHGLPATYDAHYLALATRLQCDFYTADARLANAVQARLPWVKLVA